MTEKQNIGPLLLKRFHNDGKSLLGKAVITVEKHYILTNGPGKYVYPSRHYALIHFVNDA